MKLVYCNIEAEETADLLGEVPDSVKTKDNKLRRTIAFTQIPLIIVDHKKYYFLVNWPEAYNNGWDPAEGIQWIG